MHVLVNCCAPTVFQTYGTSSFSRLLIGILVRADNALGCHEDNLDIKPERPVLYIPDITADTFLHLPELLGLTTEPGNLSPTCDTRLGEVANHILIYQASIHLCMMQHVRARTHNTHVSLKNIEELRKLIYVRLSHKVAESKFTWVVLCCLCPVCILVHMHGTEFKTVEGITIQTRSCLFEENWTRTLNLDDESYEWNEW